MARAYFRRRLHTTTTTTTTTTTNDNNNSNNNNNRIERRNSRFFNNLLTAPRTVSKRNRVQTCANIGRLSRAICVPRGTKGQLSY